MYGDELGCGNCALGETMVQGLATRGAALGALLLAAVVVAACEYEFKEDAAGKSSSLVLLRDVPRDSREHQGVTEPQKPAQPPDVRPTLVPGKEVSGKAELSPKLKKLNLPDLVEQGAVTVSTNVAGLGDGHLAFDEVDSTLSKSEGRNPFVFTFRFSNPQALKAVRVLSTYSDFGVAVDVEGVGRFVVDTVIDGEWAVVSFPDGGAKISKVVVEVLRKHRDNYVHLNEIEMYSSN